MFCGRQKIDPVCVSVTDTINFLSELFINYNLSYSAVNSARSALSALTLNAPRKIGSHPLVVKFMQGVYNLKPTNPRYKQIWDVSLLINYLVVLQPLEELSLVDLTYKLVCLVAVISAARCDTISKLCLENMVLYNDKVVFNVTDLIKQSRPGFKNPQIVIRSYPMDTRKCPLITLLRYLEVTKKLRKDNKRGSLFISTQRPHSGVTSATIGRWIKKTLVAAGIDTSRFTAHSVRSATVSKLKKKGVPVDFILSCVGWTNHQTFARYYNKPIQEETNVTEVVLDN